jgi:hypothetical protein
LVVLSNIARFYQQHWQGSVSPNFIYWHSLVALPGNIDWETGKIRVRSPKTEHHPQDNCKVAFRKENEGLVILNAVKDLVVSQGLACWYIDSSLRSE